MGDQLYKDKPLQAVYCLVAAVARRVDGLGISASLVEGGVGVRRMMHGGGEGDVGREGKHKGEGQNRGNERTVHFESPGALGRLS